jgi:hypothetical protein
VANDGNGCTSQATTTVVKNVTGCAGSTAFATGASRTAVLPDAAVDSLTGFAYKAYPNPWRSTTIVEFVSPESVAVTVELYSPSGYKERVLFSGPVNANEHYKVSIGAAGLSLGAHFCIIRTAEKVYSIKLLLVK